MFLSEYLRLSSSISTIANGIQFLILWIVAANDKGTTQDNTGAYYCRGCYWQYHDLETTNTGVNFPSTTDPYPLLIAFGVICGLAWIAIGLFGFLTKSRLTIGTYFFAGSLNYLLFVILFADITEKTMVYVFKACGIPSFVNTQSCSNDNNWWEKHQTDSFDEFWGSSVVAFVLGAYQIGCAVYLWLEIIKEGYSLEAGQSAPIPTYPVYRDNAQIGQGSHPPLGRGQAPGQPEVAEKAYQMPPSTSQSVNRPGEAPASVMVNQQASQPLPSGMKQA